MTSTRASCAGIALVSRSTMTKLQPLLKLQKMSAPPISSLRHLTSTNARTDNAWVKRRRRCEQPAVSWAERREQTNDLVDVGTHAPMRHAHYLRAARAATCAYRVPDTKLSRNRNKTIQCSRNISIHRVFSGGRCGGGSANHMHDRARGVEHHHTSHMQASQPSALTCIVP